MRRLLLGLVAFLPLLAFSQRQEMLLEKGWRFVNQEVTDAWRIDYNDNAWQQVTVPHDWAIYGPFDGNNDR
jgi:beta-galactosidase